MGMPAVATLAMLLVSMPMALAMFLVAVALVAAAAVMAVLMAVSIVAMAMAIMVATAQRGCGFDIGALAVFEEMLIIFELRGEVLSEDCQPCSTTCIDGECRFVRICLEMEVIAGMILWDDGAGRLYL